MYVVNHKKIRPRGSGDKMGIEKINPKEDKEAGKKE